MFCQGRDVVLGFTLAGRRAVSDGSQIVRQNSSCICSGGKTRAKPTPYREEQNIIRDSRTRGIVYMPPEAKFVPGLMAEMVAWINSKDELPVPLKAAIAHYQYATIPPVLRREWAHGTTANHPHPASW